MAGISPKWHIGLHDVLCCKKIKEIWCNKHNLSQAQNWLSLLSAWLFYLTVFLSVCLSVIFTLSCLPVVLTACLLFSLSIYSVCLFSLSVFLSVFTVCLLSLLSACCSHCLLFFCCCCFFLFFCKGWKVSRIAKLKLKPQHIFGGNLCHSNV